MCLTYNETFWFWLRQIETILVIMTVANIHSDSTNSYYTYSFMRKGFVITQTWVLYIYNFTVGSEIINGISITTTTPWNENLLKINGKCNAILGGKKYFDLNSTHQWPFAETYWEINPSELLVWQASPASVNPFKIQGKKEQIKPVTQYRYFFQNSQTNRKVLYFLYCLNKFPFVSTRL